MIMIWWSVNESVIECDWLGFTEFTNVYCCISLGNFACKLNKDVYIMNGSVHWMKL